MKIELKAHNVPKAPGLYAILSETRTAPNIVSVVAGHDGLEVVSTFACCPLNRLVGVVLWSDALEFSVPSGQKPITVK